MKVFKIMLYLTLYSLISCNNQEQKTVTSINDTTRVIEFAIREALYNQNLPSLGQLRDKYYFKNQILFTADSLSLEVLPRSVDTINFKVLPEDQICKIIRFDTLEQVHPNYLCVHNLAKTDSGYYMNISSLSCLPYAGGGVMGIDILKRNDSFIVLHKGFSSIN
jgi:hypothetical protein